jgi:glyoxylase-like metal-dependent hydrolase (beta-lactamase superfamily II)
MNMIDVQQVTSDLYLLPLPIREGWSGSVLLVLGTSSIGLIDTGFAQTPTERIFPAVQQLGRRLDDIQYVVNTHRDRDHVEGNAQIKLHTPATIAIHELEAEAVEHVDVTFRDDARVDLGDRQFRVIHCPGHRPGNICLYDSTAQLLLAGDTVCGTRTNLIRMDPTIHIASLERLLTLDLQHLVMAHPFQPMGKNVLQGTECAEMIHASLQIAKNVSHST